MPSNAPSAEEWLLELQRISSHSDEGFTAAEWAQKLGIGIRLMREKLNEAKAKGWVRIGRQTRQRLDDQFYQAKVYLVTKGKK